MFNRPTLPRTSDNPAIESVISETRIVNYTIAVSILFHRVRHNRLLNENKHKNKVNINSKYTGFLKKKYPF